MNMGAFGSPTGPGSRRTMDSPPPPPWSSRGSIGKWFALGCAVVMAVMLIASAVFISFGAKHFSQIFAQVMSQSKAQMNAQLNAEGEGPDNERFMRDYGIMVDEVKRLGLMQWFQTYQGLIAELRKINSDQKITPEEAETWCDMAEASFAANGYQGDLSPPEASAQPAPRGRRRAPEGGQEYTDVKHARNRGQDRAREDQEEEESRGPSYHPSEPSYNNNYEPSYNNNSEPSYGDR